MRFCVEDQSVDQLIRFLRNHRDASVGIERIEIIHFAAARNGFDLGQMAHEAVCQSSNSIWGALEGILRLAWMIPPCFAQREL